MGIGFSKPRKGEVRVQKPQLISKKYNNGSPSVLKYQEVQYPRVRTQAQDFQPSYNSKTIEPSAPPVPNKNFYTDSSLNPEYKEAEAREKIERFISQQLSKARTKDFIYNILVCERGIEILDGYCITKQVYNELYKKVQKRNNNCYISY